MALNRIWRIVASQFLFVCLLAPGSVSIGAEESEPAARGAVTDADRDVDTSDASIANDINDLDGTEDAEAVSPDDVSLQQVMDMSLRDLMDLTIESESATRKPMTIEKAPGTVYSFSGEQLQAEGVRTIEDLLARIPGVQLTPNRQGHTAAWIRGIQGRYNSKILLIVDGVPIRDAYYQNFLLDEMHPIDHIDTIEVLAGPGSVMYGANAFAGIIKIKTKAQIDDVEVSGSSFETYSASSHLHFDGFSFGDFSLGDFSLYVKGLHSEDGFIPEFGRDGKVRRIGQDSDRQLYIVGVRWDIFDCLTFSLSKTLYEYPITSPKFDRSQHISRDPLIASLTFSHTTETGFGINAVAYYVDYDFESKGSYWSEDGPLVQEKYKRNELNTQYGGVDASLSKELGDHTLIAGTNVMVHSSTDGSIEFDFRPDAQGNFVLHSADTNVFDADKHFIDFGFYIQDTWSVFPTLDVTVGGRYDNSHSFGDHFNGRIGVVWSGPDGLYVKGLLGTAYRAPSYREYRKVDEDTRVWDPTIESERVTTTELGVGREGQWYEWLVTAFFNQYRDLIADVYNAALDDEVFTNVGGMDIKGVELSGSWWFLDRMFRIDGNMTYIDKPLNAFSEWILFANFVYLPLDNLSMGVQVKYASRPFVDNGYQTGVPPAQQNPRLRADRVQLGAFMTYRPTDALEVRLSARNITNERDYIPHYAPSSNYDYELPGAWADVSVRYRF